jgi:CBS domain containing-hemolysin-like protein
MSPNLLNRSADAEQSRRPATVDYAVYALIVRCVFSVLSALAAYGARPELTDAIAKANRSKNWTADQLRHNVDSYLRETVITVLLLSVMVLVMAKFLRDGKNWARWLYVAFAILLTGDVQHVLGIVQYHNLLLRLASGVTGLAALAALVLMFLPASNQYLRPTDGRAGMFGSILGARTSRPAARADEPAAAEPAVDLTKADQPAPGSSTVEPVGSSEPAVSAGQPTGSANRRTPRAKSRRQPTE